MRTALFILLVMTRAVLAQAGGDPCATVTKGAQKACVSSAKGDYALALAKCANIADPAAQKLCAQQAKDELGEALEDCNDQEDARAEACDRLGGGVYDPPINPAHFT